MAAPLVIGLCIWLHAMVELPFVIYLLFHRPWCYFLNYTNVVADVCAIGSECALALVVGDRLLWLGGIFIPSHGNWRIDF
jgi:hypothetical protein